MLANASFMPSGQGGLVSLLFGLVLPIVIILTFWYGTNSDRDDIPPLLTQLLPAGHAACKSSTTFECSSCLTPVMAYVNQTESDLWTYEYARDAGNEGLSDTQCASAFPGLFEDVDQGVAYWKKNEMVPAVTLNAIQLENGMTRALIYEGHLYIVATK